MGKVKIGSKTYNITKKTNLGKVLARVLSDKKSNLRMSIDDFYDKVGVPKNARTNFGTASLLNSAHKTLKGIDVEKMEIDFEEVGKLERKMAKEIDKMGKRIRRERRKKLENSKGYMKVYCA